MPYRDNRGVRIHYRVDGTPTGPPLVLQIGFLLTLQEWYEAGYVAALGGTYRLILVDPRGHGASDRPHDPDAYHDRLMASDVVAVLDDLGVAKAGFFGYAMGAVVGYALAIHAPERFHSFIFGDGNPGKADPAAPSPLRDLLRQGMETFADAAAPMFGPRMTPALRARLLESDAEALVARTLAEQDGYEGILAEVTAPCLFVVGGADRSHDATQAVSARMPRATFVTLPGLDHVECFYRSDLVLPHVQKFLAEVQ